MVHRSLGHNSNGVFATRTDDCAKVLLQVEPGATITYQEFTAQIGEPISGGYGPLQTALRRLQKKGIAFETLYGLGYRRLDDNGAITHKVRGFARRTYRAAKRGLRLSTAVPDRNLDRQARVTKWQLEASLQAAATKTHGNAIRSTERKESLFDQERRRIAAEALERLARPAETT